TCRVGDAARRDFHTRRSSDLAEALKRSDAAYVGMIGSKTKKETFRRWYLREAGGGEADFARLVSPIGGDGVRDKRPSVIAALARSEEHTSELQSRENLVCRLL